MTIAITCGKCGHVFTSAKDYMAKSGHGCNQTIDKPSFACPRCGRRNFDPEHIAQGYCAHCADWTHDTEESAT